MQWLNGIDSLVEILLYIVGISPGAGVSSASRSGERPAKLAWERRGGEVGSAEMGTERAREEEKRVIREEEQGKRQRDREIETERQRDKETERQRIK